MRNTGSRDPRESLDASAVSPCSIAVNTFSIRFGSRRNQRPVHQKIRSITTVRPMIETMRIGHMMGPPLRKLSINQLLARAPPDAGVSMAAGAGLSVAAILAVGAAGPPAGAVPVGSCAGAAGLTAPGAPGLTAVGAPGLTAAGAPGLAAVGAPGLATGGAPGGDVRGGAGDCASEFSANASEIRQAVSSVFIV